jgi:hypothetical protein
MHKAILLFFLGALSPQAFTQSTFDLHNLNCKKGVYLSFNEIYNDEPSFTDSFNIKERPKDAVLMWGGGNYTFELASNSDAEYKKLKRDLVGISDGVNFFISDNYIINGARGLTLCILSGPYIIANVQGNAGQFTGGGLIPALIKVESAFLINIKDGTSVPMTKKVLKRLLKSYPAIEKKYSGKKLTDFSVQIVDEINTQMKSK